MNRTRPYDGGAGFGRGFRAWARRSASARRPHSVGRPFWVDKRSALKIMPPPRFPRPDGSAARAFCVSGAGAVASGAALRPRPTATFVPNFRVSPQGCKPKAYTISEIETLDEPARKTYAPHAEAAMVAAGGRTFYTAGGQFVPLIGEAPKRVALIEWSSLEQALAFYQSKAWTELAAERDRAQHTTRMYAVEARRP